jgi:protein O-mannosyl-transferase
VNRQKLIRADGAAALRAALAAVLLAAFAAYLPSMRGEFQYDDQEIAKTTWVREIHRALEPSYWRGMDRPLTGVTFALNHAMAGFRPLVWHATNVLVHLAVVVLAWRFARAIFARAGLSAAGETVAVPEPPEKGKGKRKKAAPALGPVPAPQGAPREVRGFAASTGLEWAALAAAAIFALHPLHTEAVSYISQRSEALASGLYLAGFLALLAWDRAEPGRRWRLLAAAIGLHALGLAAKPIAATLPAAWLLAAAVLPVRAERDRELFWVQRVLQRFPGATPLLAPWVQRVLRRIPAAAPLFALSLYAALSGVVGVRGSGHAGYDLGFVTPLQYVATQMRALPIYLRLVLWPAGLNADWQFPFSRSFSEPAVLAGTAFLALLVAGTAIVARRFAGREGDRAAVARLAAFGILFFVVVLAPTTLVPLRDPFVEHRLYLASLGIVLAVTGAGVVALRKLGPTRARIAGAVAALAVLGALGTATALRNRVWHSALALWEDASRKSPGKPRIWVNLGTAYHFAGRYGEAVDAYDRAVALGFDPTVPLELVVRNTALALVRLRRYDEARNRLVRYLRNVPRDAGTLVILALVQADTDQLDDAERSARAALQVDPRLSRPYQILGQVQEKRGDLQGAFDHFATASRMDPADPLPVYSMGRIDEKRGRIAQACSAYARATDALARSSAAKTAAAAYQRLCTSR